MQNWGLSMEEPLVKETLRRGAWQNYRTADKIMMPVFQISLPFLKQPLGVFRFWVWRSCSTPFSNHPRWLIWYEWPDMLNNLWMHKRELWRGRGISGSVMLSRMFCHLGFCGSGQAMWKLRNAWMRKAIPIKALYGTWGSPWSWGMLWPSVDLCGARSLRKQKASDSHMRNREQMPCA